MDNETRYSLIKQPLEFKLPCADCAYKVDANADSMKDNYYQCGFDITTVLPEVYRTSISMIGVRRPYMTKKSVDGPFVEDAKEYLCPQYSVIF